MWIFGAVSYHKYLSACRVILFELETAVHCHVIFAASHQNASQQTCVKSAILDLIDMNDLLLDAE